MSRFALDEPDPTRFDDPPCEQCAAPIGVCSCDQLDRMAGAFADVMGGLKDLRDGIAEAHTVQDALWLRRLIAGIVGRVTELETEALARADALCERTR